MKQVEMIESVRNKDTYTLPIPPNKELQAEQREISINKWHVK